MNKRIKRNVPRIHVHVYEVKETMVEVDFVSDMTAIEAREMAIEAVKQKQNVNSPTKSDCEFIAISFRSEDEHHHHKGEIR